MLSSNAFLMTSNPGLVKFEGTESMNKEKGISKTIYEEILCLCVCVVRMHVCKCVCMCVEAIGWPWVSTVFTKAGSLN